MKKTVKRGAALLLTVCLLLSGAVCLAGPAGAVASYVDFNDLADGAWYSNYLNQSLLEGFFIGTSASTFEPARSITRGEALTVLGRLHERLTGQTILSAVEDPYPDVKTTAFYGKYVAWAKEEKLILNEEGSSFKPGEGILQNELATLLLRYRMRLLTGKLTGKVKENTPIARDLAWWAEQTERMQALEAYGEFADVTGLMERDEGGKLTGYGDLDEVVFQEKRFAPDGAVIRGESCCFFVRFYQWMAFAGDPVTRRDVYRWEDTPDENGTVLTGLTFAEDSQKKIQRGWGVLTTREEYDRLTGTFLQGKTPEETGLPLELGEGYFDQHQLLVLEYTYKGRPELAMDLSLMTLDPQTAALAEGEESGAPESGGEEPEGGQPEESGQEPEIQAPAEAVNGALTLTMTAAGCAHQTNGKAGHVLMLVEIPKSWDLTGVSQSITLLAEDEMTLGYSADRD